MREEAGFQCPRQGFLYRGYGEAKKSQWVAADHDLRVALPALKGNDATLGPALFNLGLANYHIGHEIGSGHN